MSSAIFYRCGVRLAQEDRNATCCKSIRSSLILYVLYTEFVYEHGSVIFYA